MATLSFTQRDWLRPAPKDRLPEILATWQAQTRSTQPIDPEQVRTTITELYALIGCPPPQIELCPSPQAIATSFTRLLRQQVSYDWQVARYTPSQRSQHLQHCLGTSVRPALENLSHQLALQLDEQLSWEIQMILEEELRQPL